MLLRKPAVRAALTVVAGAMALTLGTTPALATAATLQVQVSQGGSVAGQNSGNVTLTDNGNNITCTSLHTSGTVPNGTKTGASPLAIGKASTLSVSGCTGPLGAATITANKLPYTLKVDSATDNNGRTDVIISGINATVSMTGCTFTVAGSAPGFFTNSNHSLSLTNSLPNPPLNRTKLVVVSVVGCAGIIVVGQRVIIIVIIIFIPPNLLIIIVIIIGTGRLNHHAHHGLLPLLS